MLTGHTALVTGVTSGIGKATLLKLLENHCTVLGTFRTKDKLDSLLAGLSPSQRELFHPYSCDLTQTSELQSLCLRIREDGLLPDILVLNAGVGYYGPHEELSVSAIAEMTAVNFTAPLVLSKLFLRRIKEAEGQILFVSSVTAGKTNNTHGCAYGATKAGLSSFAKSLFEEVRKYGVRVTVLAPDMTDTGLYRNADFSADTSFDCSLSPSEVADSVVFALTQRKGLNLTEITLQPQRHRLKKK